MSINAKVRELRAGTSKGLSHRPDLVNRVHLVSEYSDQVSAELDEFGDYARIFQVYAWVHKAISKKAEAIAPLKVQVINADGKAISGHPVTELLAYVNDQMNPAQLWTRWVVHMDLAGESFFEVVDDQRGRPVELWSRRPDQVRVRPDVNPDRKYYPRVAEYVWGEDDLVINAEGMIHDRYYNPLNLWRGLPPIAAVREGIVIDLFAQAWSKMFLQKGARPDYAVVAPQGITQSEREEIEATLTFKFGGVDNWHKPIVLEQGITDVKPFSFPPKDMEWMQQREFARDEVAAVLGVPDEIMGYGRDTYENFNMAYKVLWLLTLVPMIGHRDNSLTHFFSKVRPLLKLGEVVSTDLSNVGVLQDDLGPKLMQAKELWGMAVPFNRIDERLGLGIGPIPGGEVGYLPFSVMAVDTDNATTRQWVAAPARAKNRKGKGMVVYGSPEHVARWKAFEARRGPHERRMQRQLKRDVQRQQNEVLRRLRGRDTGEELGATWARIIKISCSANREIIQAIRAESSAEAAERLKQELPIPDINELLDWPEEIRLFIETYQRHIDDAVLEFGEAELRELLVQISFDLTNPLVADAIKEMLIKFAQDINQTTQTAMATKLREILLEAEESGWSIPQIQEQIYDRISQVFNVRKSDYETERIARTEMVKAANMGSLEGMRQSGVVQLKGWLAALDDRTRETHIEAHRRYHESPIPLEGMFEVGRDRMAAPGQGRVLEEIINCRCTVYAVIE